VADHLRLGLDARLHLADLGDDLGVELVGPHERLGGREQLASEVEVAGDRARLDQRLELPGLGPPLPVR
jgi:hypothetical protein